MKLYAPEYYKEFHCIADKCKNNCCKAGWEIDIDDATADLYSKVPDQFGKKLKQNIDFKNSNHFILDKHGICPFLNDRNLCEIYIHLGADSLCQICTDHPRYYEWFGDTKECGIGLCCEEAARIILSQNKPFTTYEIEVPAETTDEYDRNLYFYLHKSRSKIISYINNETTALNSGIRNILWYAYTIQQNIDSDLLDDEDIFEVSSNSGSSIKPILEFFLALEPNNDTWITYLKDCINLYDNSFKEITDFEKNNTQINKYLKNISIYFIWRYFLKGTFDGEVLSKIKLMAISIAVLKYLFFCNWVQSHNLTLDDCIDITRRYSEEIEYSEDNLLALADASYEMDIFSTENLMGLFL